MKYQDLYQGALIFFAGLVLVAIGVFVYREVFPEYKRYQYVYEDLERLRAARIGEKPAPFETGIKQIVRPDPENGPEIIDRCISCHVAVQMPHFSPARVALDVNDNPILDGEGNPVLEPNPDYIWDLAPEELRMVDGVNMTKVLAMHPLMPGETRPFEFHSMEEYGCTSCHSGNGRALVAKRAHGPVYDGEYEAAEMGPKPQFLERDAENDPAFARMYNSKPGHDLVFQTTPLYVGPLMEAKCAQCHQKSNLLDPVDTTISQKKAQLARIEKGLEDDKKALATLHTLKESIEQQGVDETLAQIEEQLGDYHLPATEIDALEGQRTFLKEGGDLVGRIDAAIGEISLEKKEAALAQGRRAVELMQTSKEALEVASEDPKLVSELKTPVDEMMTTYHRGKELYISQACYACHRIAGFSRSSVGPELTRIGLSYPWYVKESIVWPQADLPSSTMPNFRLDHEEVGDLMAFLMAQTGQTKAVSEVDYKISMKAWEEGAKLPLEEPVSPTKIDNVRFGMTVFATEGCAACHKLEGFDTNAKLENEKDKKWFLKLFPEQIQGSELAEKVEAHSSEIDHRIVKTDDGIIEELQEKYPGLVEGFYANFKFAERKNASPAYQERLQKVLKIYIEEYGLGRDIAPHLNFSGIYRDDAWLMGHFHNPAAYTAKSIMPVMPFDDTKFYALNYMLHELGKENRQELQDLWKGGGFNPALAYEQLCASCHGEQRQGNGIISEWIYPVPKNLRNPVFLRALTKEKAIESITRGVKGTPMPPWGEGYAKDVKPVLSQEQITQLVDWLYQGLPESEEKETEKWSYIPENFGQDFETREVDGEERYYIRDAFYTKKNLEAGKEFFVVNCASCHGKEGTGTGERAATIFEAKPRMLTNLPWLRTRDDLRLVRSIKFGVPGTAMTPWGDQTTPLQRLQLVAYIRELTRKTLLSDDLDAVLYDVFDTQEIAINERRTKEYRTLEAIEKEYRQTLEKRLGETDPAAAARLYEKELELKDQVEKRKEIDATYVKKIERVREEKQIYATVGQALIAAEVKEEVVLEYFNLIKSRDSEKLYDHMVAILTQRATRYDARISELQVMRPTAERTRELKKLLEEKNANTNLRTQFVVEMANAKKLRGEARG